MENKGRTHTYALLSILLIPEILISQTVCATGTFPWKPSWMPHRDDLLCYEDWCGTFQIESDVLDVADGLDGCCPCHHVATWERDETLLTDLYVEFMNIFLDSIMTSLQLITNASLYQIIQTHSGMTRPPTNICDVPTLIKIDFSNNLIRSLQGFECVVSLDTLILHHNRITTVPNDTFNDMHNIRNVDLSHNNIIDIAPITLVKPGITLLNFNASFNQLQTLDISNSIMYHPFCDLNFNGNSILKLTNTENLKFDLERTYGPGSVYLGTALKEIPDLKTLLQLDSLAELGKLLKVDFNMASDDIKCDCTFVRTAQSTWGTIDSIFIDQKLFCGEPKHLKGLPVFKISLETLTCKLEVDSGCPLGCLCVDQPYYDRVIVDCRAAGMDQLPTYVPNSTYSNKLQILASHNSIQEISEDVYYLDKVEVLDLSNNNLVEFPEDVAQKLENASSILLHNNPLKYLPQSLQYRNPCAVRLDGLTVQCGCDSLWIYNWLDTRKCANYTPNFYCVVDGHGTIPATQFKPNMLDCVEYDPFVRNLVIGMSVFILVLIVAIILLYVYRYGILILFTVFVHEKLKGMRLYENALRYDRKLKAYLRTGNVVEFTNDERNIKQRIREELGILCTTTRPVRNIDGNVNNTFRRRKVYPTTLNEYN